MNLFVNCILLIEIRLEISHNLICLVAECVVIVRIILLASFFGMESHLLGSGFIRDCFNENKNNQDWFPRGITEAKFCHTQIVFLNCSFFKLRLLYAFSNLILNEQCWDQSKKKRQKMAKEKGQATICITLHRQTNWGTRNPQKPRVNYGASERLTHMLLGGTMPFWKSCRIPSIRLLLSDKILKR